MSSKEKKQEGSKKKETIKVSEESESETEKNSLSSQASKKPSTSSSKMSRTSKLENGMKRKPQRDEYPLIKLNENASTIYLEKPAKRFCHDKKYVIGDYCLQVGNVDFTSHGGGMMEALILQRMSKGGKFFSFHLPSKHIFGLSKAITHLIRESGAKENDD